MLIMLRILPIALLALAGAPLLGQCYVDQTGAAIGTGDDLVLPMQALGFAFPFGTATYGDVHVCTNGFVYLSNAGVPAPGGALCCQGSTAQLVLGSPKIAPYWSDLDIVAGTGQVLFNTLPGVAVITWRDAIELGDQTRFSCQLQLHASGEIVFAYDGRCRLRTGGDFLVGLSTGNGAPVPAPSDFATTGFAAATTLFEIFNLAGPGFDLTGQTLQLVPVGGGYAWLASRCVAEHTPYGSGCYTAFTSFYEELPASAFDLAGTSMSMVFTGQGYAMQAGNRPFVAPGPAATALGLLDDSEATVPLSAALPFPGGATVALTVCSNGYVSAGPGNGVAFDPDPAAMLAAPVTGWWNWHDFNPTAPGSGAVKFEEVAGIAYVTWDAVYSYGTSHAETFQLQFELANGSVHFVWTTLGGVGNEYLVGYSPGGASDDPGPRDLSQALPATFATAVADQRALSLTAAPAPLPGAVVTWTTSAIPELVVGSGVHVALHVLSLTALPAPGIDLGLLGASGCAALLGSLDSTQAMVATSSTQTVTFTVPPGTPVGTQFFAQSIALFTPFALPNGQNALGLSTSNALAAHVGLW